MDRTGEEFAVVSATVRPELVVPSAGPNVTLGHRLGVSEKGNESAGIEQDWVLQIDQEQVAPLQMFVEVASDFQDLVGIASGRTAEFRRVVLLHPELPLRSLAGAPMGKARQELIYHARWTNRVDYDAGHAEDRNPMSGSRMYFTLNDIGVGRWLDTAVRFRTELGTAMATRYGQRAYLEDRIMNVCAALESFDKHHRGTNDRVLYVKRVAACVELAGDVFRDLIAERRDEWSKQVKELRHDLAHHRDQFRLDGSVGGHVVSEQLFWLFALCMLRVAQAPDAVFESMTKHEHWKWLRDKARETLLS